MNDTADVNEQVLDDTSQEHTAITYNEDKGRSYTLHFGRGETIGKINEQVYEKMTLERQLGDRLRCEARRNSDYPTGSICMSAKLAIPLFFSCFQQELFKTVFHRKGKGRAILVSTDNELPLANQRPGPEVIAKQMGELRAKGDRLLSMNAKNGLVRIGSLQPVEGIGILDSRVLPDAGFVSQWEAIIVNREVKDRLLAQAVLNFTIRPQIDRARLPIHGVILLVGPPGTGKTSLARGLATRTAESLKQRGDFLYIEVEPHALASAALGKSQKAITELLGTTIAEQAAIHPVIVLLDEVETLAADRSKLSLEANPVDVHRATDAVLAQLDHLAAQFPNLLFIATSNFPQAIDAAFLSRADLIVNVDLPGSDARLSILRDALTALSETFPKCKALLDESDLQELAGLCEGIDGRRLRKIVVSACAARKEVALDPNQLTIADLRVTIERE